jgi:hypothetical protein
MRDGLPKMKDLPKEMGGSGETLPDDWSRAPSQVARDQKVAAGN